MIEAGTELFSTPSLCQMACTGRELKGKILLQDFMRRHALLFLFIYFLFRNYLAICNKLHETIIGMVST